MTYSHYATYVHTGNLWAPHIPAHWSLAPLKWHLVKNDGGVWGDEPDGINDTVVLRSTDQTVDGHWQLTEPALRRLHAEDIASALLHAGDLLVTKSSGSSQHIGKTTLVTEDIARNGCCFSNFMQRIRPDASILPKLAWYLLNSDFARTQFDALSNTTTGLANLNSSMIGSLVIPLPPLDEQQSIVALLDRETSRIDTLIAGQSRGIVLLQEKSQALISHAVTQGLNPDAAMTTTGVNWLGRVPAHWVLLRNKAVFIEIDDRAETDEGELLTVSHLTGVTRRSEKSVNMFLAETLEGYKKCLRDDLVINTMWAWMGALGVSPCDGVVSPSYNVYRRRKESQLSMRFYDYLCRIPTHRTEIKAQSSGVWESRLRLYPDAFMNMRIAVPPLEEQERIADHLDAEDRKLQNLLRTAQLAVALLEERRTALISAVVTGQIDVRHVGELQPA